MPSTVLTANRLADGAVVFLDRVGLWVTDFASAAVFADGRNTQAMDQAKLDEENRVVVDPYPVDVETRDGATVPKTLREVIRARGPTISYARDRRTSE